MQNIALVFPGQGSQSVGMLNELINNDATLIKRICEEASDTLGYDMAALITNDAEQKLNKTEYTQPALLTTSYAAWQIMQKNHGLQPRFFAGHSLGEYSALVCAKALDFAAGLKLVAKRGDLMQRAVAEGTGAMAAILGLDLETVSNCCTAAGAEAANINAPGQIVIAGNKQTVESAIEVCKAAGAKKAILLPVSVPSHCSLMRPAAEEFAHYLKEVNWQKPEVAIIHNYDVASHNDAASIVEVLIKQLYSPVRWVETIEYFVQQGVEDILECAPGKVLTGLNKRIAPQIWEMSDAR